MGLIDNCVQLELRAGNALSESPLAWLSLHIALTHAPLTGSRDPFTTQLPLPRITDNCSCVAYRKIRRKGGEHNFCLTLISYAPTVWVHWVHKDRQETGGGGIFLKENCTHSTRLEFSVRFIEINQGCSAAPKIVVDPPVQPLTAPPGRAQKESHLKPGEQLSATA